MKQLKVLALTLLFPATTALAAIPSFSKIYEIDNPAPWVGAIAAESLWYKDNLFVTDPKGQKSAWVSLNSGEVNPIHLDCKWPPTNSCDMVRVYSWGDYPMRAVGTALNDSHDRFRIFELEGGKTMHEVQLPRWVNDYVLVPEKHSVLFNYEGGELQVWNYGETGKPFGPEFKSGEGYREILSHNNNLAVVRRNDRYLEIWDLQYGDLVALKKFSNRDAVFGRFLPNGEVFLTTCDLSDCTAQVWDIESDKIESLFEYSSSGFDQWFRLEPVKADLTLFFFRAVDWSTHEGHGYIFDRNTGTITKIFAEDAPSLFSFDQKRAVTIGRKKITLWKIE